MAFDVHAELQAQLIRCTYLNSAEVHEKIRSTILRRDEAEALGLVEPLDGSLLALRHLDGSFLID